MIKAGGVGHDSQSMPDEISPRAYFHLIVEQQTLPRAYGDVEIWLTGDSLASDAKRNLECHPYEMFRSQIIAVHDFSIYKATIFNAEQIILGVEASRLVESNSINLSSALFLVVSTWV